jgi:hypothetical protein
MTFRLPHLGKGSVWLSFLLFSATLAWADARTVIGALVLRLCRSADPTLHPGGQRIKGDYTRQLRTPSLRVNRARGNIAMILRGEYLPHARQGGQDAPLGMAPLSTERVENLQARSLITTSSPLSLLPMSASGH